MSAEVIDFPAPTRTFGGAAPVLYTALAHRGGERCLVAWREGQTGGVIAHCAWGEAAEIAARALAEHYGVALEGAQGGAA